MDRITIDTTQVKNYCGTAIMAETEAKAKISLQTLLSGQGAGSDYLGWLKLPSEIDSRSLEEMSDCAAAMRECCDTVVVVGIGGSYLGAKAVIEALSDNFSAHRHQGVEVLFAGQNIGEDYLYDLLDYLDSRRFGIIVISKSGTTTEPAIAFRLLRDKLEQKIGAEQASKRIVAITDRHRGALRKLADQQGYKSFVIEDNVGGRYSVLTPVGLLPIAVAGYDIKALVEGARTMQTDTTDGDAAMALDYAAARNALYSKGKKIEILTNFYPALHYVGEWWKQLYGESEGKDHKGIFPASADFSTDLHSMGQWIQDGERTIFETFISVERAKRHIVIPDDKNDLDGLNYLAGKNVDHVNKMAELGTRLAHIEGGVPVIVITMPRVDEHCLGQMIYFFEAACGISGYMLGVNPFNQPGVEAYKKNMFALLEKPGYEEATAKIRQDLEGV